MTDSRDFEKPAILARSVSLFDSLAALFLSQKSGGFIRTARLTKTARLRVLSADSHCEQAKRNSAVIANVTGTIQTT